MKRELSGIITREITFDSAIVTVAAEGALERLRVAGVKASVRAGAVRLAFHLHNTEADVDAIVRALRS